uniref:Saposin B-type domain-containing protein n=1 Tax=Meloidogyne hapla TaxID=6305 RepID=A0A1I8BCA7_MELHA
LNGDNPISSQIGLGKGVNALLPSQICDNCQKVIFFAFQHYRQSSTKRQLKHWIKHLCNRYFEYRRRCHSKLEHNFRDIWSDIESVLDTSQRQRLRHYHGVDTKFKPYKTCEKLKECGKEQSPIDWTKGKQTFEGETWTEITPQQNSDEV